MDQGQGQAVISASEQCQRGVGGVSQEEGPVYSQRSSLYCECNDEVKY